MIFTRRYFLLVTLSLALGVIPESFASDPGIGTQISKLKHALNSPPGPDVKRIRAAASSLAQKLPAALAAPAAPGQQDYQVNSAISADEPATDEPGVPPELTLDDDQRETLINAYQAYVEKINTLAGQNPLDGEGAGQVAGAVTALERFMTRLDQLVPMKRSSGKYLNAVRALVAEEKQKGH